MMSRSRSNTNKQAVLIGAVFLASILAVVFGVGLSSVGRSSLYQGMQLSWEGAEVGGVVYDWCGAGSPGSQGVPINHYYTDGDLNTYTKVGGSDPGNYTASVSNFRGTVFNLDVDEIDDHTPNLRGSVDDPYPHELTVADDGLFKTYSWDVGVAGSDTDVHVEMDEWIYETNFNVVASPTGRGERMGRFSDTTLWLKVEPFTPTYLDHPDLELNQVYFALAAIEIEEITLGFGKLTDEEKERYGIKDSNSPTRYVGAGLNEGLEVTVFYESPGGASFSYGNTETAAREAVKRYYYQGIALDPDVFKPVYYIPLEVTSWGSHVGGWLCDSWSVDVMSVKARVHLFSIGEWDVKKETHVEWGQLITPTGTTSPFDKFIGGLEDFFTSPMGILFMLIAVGVVLVILLIIGMPIISLIMPMCSMRSAGRGQTQQPRNIPSRAEDTLDYIRQYRDLHLRTHWYGRATTFLYYRIFSPPLCLLMYLRILPRRLVWRVVTGGVVAWCGRMS